MNFLQKFEKEYDEIHKYFDDYLKGGDIQKV